MFQRLMKKITYLLNNDIKIAGNNSLNIIPYNSNIKGFKCTVRGTGNEIIICNNVYIRNMEIDLKGDSNKIIIEPNVHFLDCSILIHDNVMSGVASKKNYIIFCEFSNLSNSHIEVVGKENKLSIGKNVYILKNANFYLRGQACEIAIGKDTSIQSALITATEINSHIKVGEDNLWSDRVTVRTGDDHPIFFKGKRQNPARDVTIGNRVWLGEDVKILKGALIPDGCIVGSLSLVTTVSSHSAGYGFQENSIIIGNPAKSIKTPIEWSRNMLYNDLEIIEELKFSTAFAESHFYKGNMKAQQKKYEEAILHYKRATELQKSFAYAYCAWGSALEHLNRLEEALNAYKEALKHKEAYKDAKDGCNRISNRLKRK
ncbi:MAG: tetratricopeptide repeat protein [Candidatus Competibacteraceae bacterium]